jgi:uncharacterized protein YjbI with pentapeptide repeats
MPVQEHIEIARAGSARIGQYRAAQPNIRFDVSGADLSGIDLSAADLSRANLAGTKFEGALLTNANLQEVALSGANLRNAKLAGANFANASLGNADFTDAEIDNTTNFTRASLDQAKIDKGRFVLTQFTGASLTNLDLSGVDFSGRDLNGMNFGSSTLTEANFTGAQMRGANLSSAKLQRARLTDCDLTGSDLMGADLGGAPLVRAKLTRATLNQANLSGTDISGCDFLEARIEQTSFEFARGAHKALHLLTTRMDTDVRYFSTVVREWPEWLLDWERIRVVGRLPLFGASYAGLILIPTYVYLLQIYNQHIETARTWIYAHAANTGLSTLGMKKVLIHLHAEPIPQSFFLLFISTIALAIAATIYTVTCPSRVKEFSRDQWRDQFGHSLIHYWPEAWKGRWLRIACALLYGTGGIGAAYVLVQKLYYVGRLLYLQPSPA